MILTVLYSSLFLYKKNPQKPNFTQSVIDKIQCLCFGTATVISENDFVFMEQQ